MVISTFQGHLEVRNKSAIKKDQTSNSLDNKPYDNGGLGRCSEHNAVSKCSMDLKIKDEENKYYAAANRLEVILSGASYDLFALDLDITRLAMLISLMYVYDKNSPLLIK